MYCSQRFHPFDSKIGHSTQGHHSVLYEDSHTLVISNIVLPKVTSTISFKYVKNHMRIVNDQ